MHVTGGREFVSKLRGKGVGRKTERKKKCQELLSLETYSRGKYKRKIFVCYIKNY